MLKQITTNVLAVWRLLNAYFCNNFETELLTGKYHVILVANDVISFVNGIEGCFDYLKD